MDHILEGVIIFDFSEPKQYDVFFTSVLDIGVAVKFLLNARLSYCYTDCFLKLGRKSFSFFRDVKTEIVFFSFFLQAAIVMSRLLLHCNVKAVSPSPSSIKMHCCFKSACFATVNRVTCDSKMLPAVL